jgi:AcrR family transcriptional regulator
MEIKPRQLEIIEAAGKILTVSGVSGLTIKNLAKEMQFSESAIYRHFPGKEEIIISMLDYLADAMDKRLQNISKPDDSPETKFAAIFHNLVGFFSQYPHFVVAVFSDGLMEESKRINQTLLNLMNIITRYLMPVIMEGQQKMLFTNSITTDEMMHIVIGTFKLQMFKWKIAGFQFDIDRAGNNIVQALLTIIRSKE